jgi:hypothetical protein
MFLRFWIPFREKPCIAPQGGLHQGDVPAFDTNPFSAEHGQAAKAFMT